MYPLTHLYVTEQVLGTLNPALALGSILPDILVGAGLKWQEAHDLKEMPNINHDLRRGDLIHGSHLPGLDYYSDCAYNEKEGYAFQYAAFLYQELVELGVPKEHALWRGHNFIEMAVEIFLSATHDHLWLHLEKAASDHELKTEVNQVINDYKLDSDNILDLILSRFLKIRGRQEFLAEDYAKKLNRIYRLEITTTACLNLIEKAKELTAKHYQQFLISCIQNITIDLKTKENS